MSLMGLARMTQLDKTALLESKWLYSCGASMWMELSDQKNVSKLDGDILALVMIKDYIHYAD